jgi:hypothetical protein
VAGHPVRRDRWAVLNFRWRQYMVPDTTCGVGISSTRTGRNVPEADLRSHVEIDARRLAPRSQPLVFILAALIAIVEKIW